MATNGNIEDTYVNYYTNTAHMSDDMIRNRYYDAELDRYVYTKYDPIIQPDNATISPIVFSNIGRDVYNYKLDDHKLNDIIYDFYSNNLQRLIRDYKSQINTPDNLDELLRDWHKHKYHIPVDTKIEPDYTDIYFNISKKSRIFSNFYPDTSNTEFKLRFMNNINKQDHAYVTVMFPEYDSNGKKSYNYLVAILLVAYMLKHNRQNWEHHGTQAAVICCVTPDVDTEIIDVIKTYYDDVIIIPYIAWAEGNISSDITSDATKFIKIQDVSRNNLPSNHAYSKVFTKLNIYTLVQYKKIILLDADLFPFCYFDSLFAINAPAGCLEQRRGLEPEYGCGSWQTDRSHFARHGEKIPKNLTDIENVYAADINASLWVIEPDILLFNDMIAELQSDMTLWFGGSTNEHKGFWLGNRFYNFYLLPEQNYVTRRLSGEWHSIDLGFSTWCLDMQDCFGFTFAGFVVKPWCIQSEFHQYSINPYIVFSRINNQYTQRSYSYQVMNHMIYDMLEDMRDKYDNARNMIISQMNQMILLDINFDPWKPEISLAKYPNKRRLCDYTIGYNYDNNASNQGNITKLSYDQKKLYYMMNRQNMTPEDLAFMHQVLYVDYLMDKLTENIYNLHYTAMSYKLIDIMTDVMADIDIMNRFTFFGNTLISFYKYGTFDINDDDNDVMLYLTDEELRTKVYEFIRIILNKNLQVYVNMINLKNGRQEFYQIMHDIVKPYYYYYKYLDKDDNILTYSELINIDVREIKYFNVSFYENTLHELIHANKLELQDGLYNTFKNSYQLKTPWVDVFLFKRNDHKLNFIANPSVTLSERIFISHPFHFYDYIKLKLLDKKFKMPDMELYVTEYYKTQDRLNYYTIKSVHHHVKARNIIFKLDMRDTFHKTLVGELFKQIHVHIYKIYNELDIKRLLFQ